LCGAFRRQADVLGPDQDAEALARGCRRERTLERDTAGGAQFEHPSAILVCGRSVPSGRLQRPMNSATKRDCGAA
jgi:hypothetical protein